jgi:hypothetical protein
LGSWIEHKRRRLTISKSLVPLAIEGTGGVFPLHTTKRADDDQPCPRWPEDESANQQESSRALQRWSATSSASRPLVPSPLDLSMWVAPIGSISPCGWHLSGHLSGKHLPDAIGGRSGDVHQRHHPPGVPGRPPRARL